MKYFNDCITLNDVKAKYRALAMLHHPDKGGNLQTMQEINSEYKFACVKCAKGENLTADQVEAEILNAEQYKDALNAIINLEGITIELCGGWLWVTPAKSEDFWNFWPTMKGAGFYFAKVKRKFYFRSPEYATANKKAQSMDQIRSKYGSQQIITRYQAALS